MIAISINKECISFPDKYEKEKLPQDLIYYYQRNLFVPEFFIKEMNKKIVVSTRGKYLEVALEIPDLLKVNAILDGEITPYIQSLVDDAKLFIRDLKKLAEDDFKNEFYELIEVIVFHEPIDGISFGKAKKMINQFITKLPKTQKKSPIELTRFGTTLEYGLRVAKFNTSFQVHQEKLINQLEEHVGKISYINGKSIL